MEYKRQRFNACMTELMIEAVTHTNMGHANEQERLVFTEVLRELVTLAKVEKLIEMKLDTMAAMGTKDEAKRIIERTLSEALKGLDDILGPEAMLGQRQGGRAKPNMRDGDSRRE